MRTLLVDNYDSYTFNLYQLIAETYGVPPEVLTNDSPKLTTALTRTFDAIVVSPGPGRPGRPDDVGRCAPVVADSRVPVLGVCLGHQLLGHLCGARVTRAPQPRHGHLTRVRHADTGLFAGVPQDFVAVRYHSLCLADPLPEELVADAWAEDGVIMSVRHRSRPWFGVQFHPESVASEHGRRLFENFRRLAWGSPSRPAPRPAPRRPVASATEAGGPGGWVLRRRRLPFACATAATFRRHVAPHPYAFWLDSSRVVPGLSRFSFLGYPGGPDGEVLRYRVDAGHVEVLDGRGRPVGTRPGTIFEALQDRLDRRRLPHDPDLPFDLQGGYVGYLGYELKADCGAPNRHTSPTPDAVWASATRFIAVDHESDATWVLALCRDEPRRVRAADAWIAEIAGRLRPAAEEPPATPPRDPVDAEPYLVRPRDGYLDDIDACLRQLRAGESYEICLTNEARLPFDGDPVGLYLRQRRLNPAPYAAYLDFGEGQVLCSSPERFLRIGADGDVEAKPIKGTAPRDPDPARDSRLRNELHSSAKTRAENLMIVDLLRNDLGRVCQVGTVHVPAFMAVESYTTVHQLVSTVRGVRDPSIPPTAVVRACFPGGSMTGAPKLRTMQIIDDLEDRPRGIYSGAIGFFGLTGATDLNIVIRTAVCHDGELRIGAGGAIVLDSDPAEEYAEMRLKLAAPLRGLGAAEVSGPYAAHARRAVGSDAGR
ncbi:aminodeoxychorismate synthase component I [Micromonospora okii]|uniref:aminodeoxychorismate synthase component I n=1 Tax=Micromonospora okii TaxID=1182970 RepID=UPI001E33D8D0|nr:aminodeoxychorismate synthase component I [Micromonospora okii]